MPVTLIQSTASAAPRRINLNVLGKSTTLTRSCCISLAVLLRRHRLLLVCRSYLSLSSSSTGARPTLVCPRRPSRHPCRKPAAQSGSREHALLALVDCSLPRKGTLACLLSRQWRSVAPRARLLDGEIAILQGSTGLPCLATTRGCVLPRRIFASRSFLRTSSYIRSMPSRHDAQGRNGNCNM